MDCRRRSQGMFVVALLLAGAGSVAAQTPAAPPAPADPPAGKLVVERIEQGWLVAPDVRAADLDGKVGSLVGGYVGRITDRTWLIGGGGYYLANRDDDFTMFYGGPVIEWLALKDHKVGFGLRTIVGGGSATMPFTLSGVRGDIGRMPSRDVRFGSRRPVSGDTRIAVRDDFFIAEPQANLLWNVTPKYRLSVGVGYRLIGAAPLLGDSLEGVSGSISLQIGGR